MATDQMDSFFSQYGKNISAPKIKKNLTIPFKDHIQFPILVDILSRKESHHAILHVDFSPKLNIYFLESLLNHLAQENIPTHLRGVELIYLDMTNLIFDQKNQANIEKYFIAMLDILNTADKYMLFAVYNFDLLLSNKKETAEFLQHQFQTLLTHPKCRFMIFSNDKRNNVNHDSSFEFTQVHIAGPNEIDIMTILKLQRAELENFHHILIPEDMLSYAYSLAERYLSNNDTLEKTLLLLDSCAARTTAIEKIDASHSSKPIMSHSTINNVVSTWTQIPAANLQMHKFKYNAFIQGMSQKLFGQDAAITLLGNELQQSQAHLQQHASPFCSFLFAGPEHSGKNTTAIALVEQLFKQTNALYAIQQTAQTLHSILETTLQSHIDKRYISLKELVRGIPYAVILYENIERAPTVFFDELQEILSTGYLHDACGNQHCFRQVIFIFTTTLGSELLTEIAKAFTPDQESGDLDLLQLVMREQKNDPFLTHHYSPQEIADKVSAYITEYLPTSLCQYLHVLPFLPLNKTAIEKIIHLKLKILGRTLISRYGIELGYAQEVIRHLANQMLKKAGLENKSVDIDKTLKQLYFIVEQAILCQIDNKNRSNQLWLQLNDTGQILRCDWLRSADVSAL